MFTSPLRLSRAACAGVAILGLGLLASGGLLQVHSAAAKDQVLLQTKQQATPATPQSLGGQAETSGPGEVHCVFTTDCRPFNLWQAELLFFSALQVGQPGPITQIVSGCSEEKVREVSQRHQKLEWPNRFKQHFVERFNDKKSIWLSKPYGVKSWYRSAGPERDVVAVLDPDFVFMRPLTPELDGRGTAIAWPGGDAPQRVKPGVVVAQRYSLVYPDDRQTGPWQLRLTAKGMDNAALLTYVCSGSTTGTSGCTNVTKHEMGFYQSTGVPYIAHRDDWDWLVDDWADITVRLHEHSHQGFLVDMWSWILANVHRKQKQLVLHNFMISDVEPPQYNYEAWSVVDARADDACDAPSIEAFLGNQMKAAGLPHFIHYCVPSESFNKYWFDWGADSGPNALERCDEGGSSSGLKNIMTQVPVRTQQELSELKRVKTMEGQHRSRFMGCAMRSLFKSALRRSCEGRPSAAFVSQGATGDSKM
mmetsp:Transcript_114922/g.297862  ORF Transcript_114922/g.297862 Transcript_114922/m.297862 type:complete len:477 (+) Transcript_114922:88-1518(+)